MSQIDPKDWKTWEERQSNDKRRLKRILRKYSTENFFLTVADSCFPKEEILNLRNEMIISGFRKKSFLDDRLIEIAKSLYETGRLIISKIVYNGKIVGISLIFKKENYYSFWIDLYNDIQMINLYHNTLFIKKITESSNATFNFGRGIYNYKIQNFAPETKVLLEIRTFNNRFAIWEAPGWGETKNTYFEYSPRTIKPGLFLNTNLESSFSLYEDGKSQNTIGLKTGPELIIGNFRKKLPHQIYKKMPLGKFITDSKFSKFITNLKSFN